MKNSLKMKRLLNDRELKTKKTLIDMKDNQ